MASLTHNQFVINLMKSTFPFAHVSLFLNKQFSQVSYISSS